MIKVMKEFYIGLIFLALLAFLLLSGCLSKPQHKDTPIDPKYLNTACINGVKYIRNYVSGGVVLTPLLTMEGPEACGL